MDLFLIGLVAGFGIGLLPLSLWLGGRVVGREDAQLIKNLNQAEDFKARVESDLNHILYHYRRAMHEDLKGHKAVEAVEAISGSTDLLVDVACSGGYTCALMAVRRIQGSSALDVIATSSQWTEVRGVARRGNAP